ncbi:MAG: phospho-N-acetylmuramoyl-pentapeptide-transferase [Clostridiales bacterium]|nr:phospho-N-acetylmuramoyl-pentapeptide-transferase [Clostridiales bacterium]
MINVLCGFLSAFAIGMLLLPLNVRLVKKLKAGQPILSYVDNHKVKQGTPTMGGASIVLAILPALFFVSYADKTVFVILIVTVGYALIGFIDDFIKVRYKNNKGLSAAQKIVFQVLLATIVSVYAYYSDGVGSSVLAPFAPVTVELGRFAPAYYIFIFLAFTNAVNLTDGLDGLAASVTATNTLFCSVMLGIAAFAGVLTSKGSLDMIVLCAAATGSLCAFLCYNTHPAKIFMGDTGSLALGGFLACVAVLGRMSLSMLLVGIMYIVTTLSVIIQVVVFKLTHGKRVFLMAPLHHHFERKGVFEGKIAVIYTLVTFVCGIVTVALMLALY